MRLLFSVLLVMFLFAALIVGAFTNRPEFMLSGFCLLPFSTFFLGLSFAYWKANHHIKIVTRSEMKSERMHRSSG